MNELGPFLAITIISNIIAVSYLAYLLPFRLKRKWLLSVPVIIMIALTFFISGFSLDDMILNFFVNCLMLLIATCFFNNILRGALYALTFEVLVLISDGLAYYATSLLFQTLNLKMSFASIAVSMNIVLLSVLTFLIAKRLKSAQQMEIPKSYWFLLLITPSAGVWLLFTIYGLVQESKSMILETTVSILALLCVIFGSTFIYGNIADYFIIKLKNQSLLSQLEIFTQKQSYLAESYQKTIEIEHDLKNRLLPIFSALESEEYQEAKIALLKEIGDMGDIRNVPHIGIACIDDMINYKAAIAREHGIFISVDNNMENYPIIPYMDISTAIGLALDNAIEACRKSSAHKKIYIDFRCQMGIFNVRIENDLVDELRTDSNGDYLTTKPDPGKHGLGIISIRNLLNKHDGKLYINTKDGKFVLDIICDSKEC